MVRSVFAMVPAMVALGRGISRLEGSRKERNRKGGIDGEEWLLKIDVRGREFFYLMEIIGRL